MPKKKVTEKSKIPAGAIRRLGIGSAGYVKNHDTSGLFFFENEEHKIIFWDKKNSKIEEQEFNTFEEFEEYINSIYQAEEEEEEEQEEEK